ncbi:hypothetical protein CCH79_00018979 [Gambusia affinis]|uniref:C-type lectin domain-containing protein n=1 Tax=Gambusia affinis TaxID=33528 RepID=A0A315VIH5_GAMAF|nr:hypothetical protein CCH79_00018979 [Gambusia affinis]
MLALQLIRRQSGGLNEKKTEQHGATEITPADCPPGWTWFQRRCFVFVNDQKSWAAAENDCLSKNGNLASFQSSDEYSFIKNLVYQTTGNYTRSWIGAHSTLIDSTWLWSDGSRFVFYHWTRNIASEGKKCMDINLEGTWMWSDGSKFIFTNWATGAPKNNGGLEHCMKINVAECYGRSGKANGLTQIFLLTSAPLQLLLAGTRALKSVFINALNESLKDVMVLLDEPETVDNLITQNFCLSLGANLASFHSVAEYNFIRNLIYKATGKHTQTWVGAFDSIERFCLSLDGHLASLTSTNDYNFIREYIYNTTKQHTETWVGGTKTKMFFQHDYWMWSDGSRFVFHNWGLSEPNNFGGNEKCMNINVEEKCAGDVSHCKGFLLHCSLAFNHSPQCFPHDVSKKSYIISLLTGRMMKLVETQFQKVNNYGIMFKEFLVELKQTFSQDPNHEGRWMWSDGTGLCTRVWSLNQPKNDGGNEHCMVVNLDGKEHVSDVECHQKLPYICAKPL